MNRVFIKGRLTRDAEIKYLPSGDAVAELGGAYSRKYKDKTTGEQKEHTVFFSAKQYGKPAEWLATTGKKGSEVLIEGELDEDRWETKEGDKRSRLFIKASDVTVFQTTYAEKKDGAAKPSSRATTKADEDQIPF